MTNEPSPRPWHTANFINGIEDANNGKVAANIRDADARLIVAAVNKHGMPIAELIKCYDALNAERDRAVKYAEAAPHPGSAPWKEMRAVYAERDRLRDIVRRLARVAQDTLYFAEAISGIIPIPDNPERAKARSEIEALLREARAALGEDKE